MLDTLSSTRSTKTDIETLRNLQSGEGGERDSNIHSKTAIRKTKNVLSAGEGTIMLGYSTLYAAQGRKHP